MPAGVVEGEQRKATAWIRSRSSGNVSRAVLPPSLTILRRRSLSELSLTVPSVVQPTGTVGGGGRPGGGQGEPRRVLRRRRRRPHDNDEDGESQRHASTGSV